MRRVLLIFAMLCVASITNAQRTYYYKHEKTINDDGSIIKGSGTLYFTFTGKIMYGSNGDGTRKATNSIYFDCGGDPTKDIYNYRGEINGCLWYCRIKRTTSHFLPPVDSWCDSGGYYLISKDYNTINYVLTGIWTKVYKRYIPENNVPNLIQ